MTTTINAKSTGIGGLDVTCDASGSLGLQTGGTTAVTINTSQNVGIGTTSPSGKFHVANANTAGTSADNLGVYFSSINRNCDVYIQAKNTEGSKLNFGDGDNASVGRISYEHSTNHMAFDINAAERMRIDSSGNLLVGTTAQQTGGNGKLSVAGGSGGVAATLTNNSASAAYTTEVYNYTTSTGAGTGRYVKFAMGSTPTQTGSIIGDGTNTAFNTSSDYRLKENIEPMTGALALVMQQRPVTWVWKSNGKLGKGFIAHWLQEDGAGECVSGEKDAVDADGNPEYQGVDTSFLVATLTAAIKEQQTIINDLKARIETLESK